MNTKQLISFPFMRLTCWYDASNVGPIRAISNRGNTPLQYLFTFFAAREVAGETANFDDIQKANCSISAAEFIKFVLDMIPYKVSRHDVMAVFQLSGLEQSQGTNFVEDDTPELEFDDFCRALVRLALVIFNDGTRSDRDAVLMLVDVLMLTDFQGLKKEIERIGRVNAGFGAWRVTDQESDEPKVRLPRIARGAHLDKYLVPKQRVTELVDVLLEVGNKSPTVVDWETFAGPYISIVLPKHMTPRKYRFRITLQNVSSTRGFPICHRISGISFMSAKFLPPRPLAAGMDIPYELWCSTPLPPGEHLGAFIFSAEENGPELFRCPIYIRVLSANMVAVEDNIRVVLRNKFADGSLLKAFSAFDKNNDGLISRMEFRNGILDMFPNMTPETLQALIMRVDADRDGRIDYFEFADKLGSTSSLGCASPGTLPSIASPTWESSKPGPRGLKKQESALDLATVGLSRTSAVKNRVVIHRHNTGAVDNLEAELLSKGRGVALNFKEGFDHLHHTSASGLPEDEQARPCSPGLPRSVAGI